MILTFFVLLFGFLFLFKGTQKNVFFILYATAMIAVSYCCENYLYWKITPFSKSAFLLFILFHIVFINLFTFFAYGRDKSLAKHGEWRIPEIQLHTLELLGGTIGAFIGQKFFHHKLKKKSFMVTFWAAVFIQIFVIIYITKYLRLF